MNCLFNTRLFAGKCTTVITCDTAFYAIIHNDVHLFQKYKWKCSNDSTLLLWFPESKMRIIPASILLQSISDRCRPDRNPVWPIYIGPLSARQDPFWPIYIGPLSAQQDPVGLRKSYIDLSRMLARIIIKRHGFISL